MARTYSEAKTKYQILTYGENNNYDSFYTDYMEFIFSLANIMKREPEYKFYINNQKEYIMKRINNANFIGEDFVKKEENYILNELNLLENVPQDSINQLREEYTNNKIKNLDIPIFSSYKNITVEQLIEINYYFLKHLYTYYSVDTKKLVEDLSYNMSSLIFINSIIKDYPEFFNDEITKIIERVLQKNKGVYDSKSFESIKSELEFTAYNARTIRNLRKLKPRKEKILSYKHK